MNFNTKATKFLAQDHKRHIDYVETCSCGNFYFANMLEIYWYDH